MTRYYIAATQADAQAIVDKIDARARELLAPLGKVDAANNLIGSNAATGQPDPSAEKTTSWCPPMQTLLGTWVILHPETWVNGADTVKDSNPPISIAQYMVQDLGTSTIASDDGTWFRRPSPHHSH